MGNLIYHNEKTLATIMLVAGIIFWIALIAGTFGIALIIVALGFIGYLFTQSAFISNIKGNGIEILPTQYPDLHKDLEDCCEKLGMKGKPRAYLLNGNGNLNAFAATFLRKDYIVLMSNLVDAMAAHEDGTKFYIGHELGHLRRKHIISNILRWPALWLPLIGAAYSRAKESTCDLHGLACCQTSENAARALAALAAGSGRWKEIDFPIYLQQTRETSDFWMSLHELIGGYPWLVKRASRVNQASNISPRRNSFSYILAAFIPYSGRLGSGFGILIFVYIIGVLAAVALPAYQDYAVKAKFAGAILSSQGARDTLGGYYQAKKTVPESLEAAGIKVNPVDGTTLKLDTDNMALSVSTANGTLIFIPRVSEQGLVVWTCTKGDDVKATQVPQSCK